MLLYLYSSLITNLQSFLLKDVQGAGSGSFQHLVGVALGLDVGAEEGCVLGFTEGNCVGISEGAVLGIWLGALEGELVGALYKQRTHVIGHNCFTCEVQVPGFRSLQNPASFNIFSVMISFSVHNGKIVGEGVGEDVGEPFECCALVPGLGGARLGM